MLILSRRLNERIELEFRGADGETLERVLIDVCEIGLHGGHRRVRLGFHASPNVRINREELAAKLRAVQQEVS